MMLASHNAPDKIKEEMLVYGLTRGVATAIVSLILKVTPTGLRQLFLCRSLPASAAVSTQVVSCNGGVQPRGWKGTLCVYINPAEDHSPSLLPLIMNADAGKTAVILIHGPHAQVRRTHTCTVQHSN